MLSYQHIYHAGNLADVQKHMALAWVLDYMTAKDKPLSYIETHAGRGLYDLGTAEAARTGEAASGILRLDARLPRAHPFARVLAQTRAAHGPMAYPGSPVIAGRILRESDALHLAELHPREHQALTEALAFRYTDIRQQDGFEMALSLCPPTPRRGILVVDPSYEVKEDYLTIPKFLSDVRRKWNVGVLMLWYPILTGGAHGPMVARLTEDHPDVLLAEVRFAPVRDGHRMVGSGLAVVNPPWGLAEELSRIAALIEG